MKIFILKLKLLNKICTPFRFYRAPEILLGLPFCEKVDMWSLGCVMAELYLGEPLYPGKSELEQVRFICETQGFPHSHLLNMATRTHLFFQITTDQHGAPAWELRPSVQGPNGEITGYRKYSFSSLDQLCSLNNEAFCSEDEAAEITDCYCMVELIKRMLAFISRQRINPDAALRHSFVTLTHLDSPDTRAYYDLSLQELQKALIQTSPTGHKVKNCNQRAEVTIHFVYNTQTMNEPLLSFPLLIIFCCVINSHSAVNILTWHLCTCPDHSERLHPNARNDTATQGNYLLLYCHHLSTVHACVLMVYVTNQNLTLLVYGIWPVGV